MAGWNGSGTFTRAYDWASEAAAGNAISSTKFDTENDAFEAGINACIAKNGENAATADLPMGGNKHTGVDEGSARNHYPAISQIQDGGVVWGGTSGGAANVQTITLSPAITAYAAGQQFAFIAGNTNTAACTLNVNSVGAKNVFSGGAACIGGELVSGQVYVVVYDGTQFHLIGRGSPVYAVSVYTTLAGQSVANSTAAAVLWGDEHYDYGSMHSTSTNTSRLVAPVDGLYHVSASIYFPSNATGYRRVALYKNPYPTYIAESILDAGSNDMVISLSGDVSLDATEYVDVFVEQTSGGAMTIGGGALSEAHMHLIRRI